MKELPCIALDHQTSSLQKKLNKTFSRVTTGHQEK